MKLIGCIVAVALSTSVAAISDKKAAREAAKVDKINAKKAKKADNKAAKKEARRQRRCKKGKITDCEDQEESSQDESPEEPEEPETPAPTSCDSIPASRLNFADGGPSEDMGWCRCQDGNTYYNVQDLWDTPNPDGQGDFGKDGWGDGHYYPGNCDWFWNRVVECGCDVTGATYTPPPTCSKISNAFLVYLIPDDLQTNWAKQRQPRDSFDWCTCEDNKQYDSEASLQANCGTETNRINYCYCENNEIYFDADVSHWNPEVSCTMTTDQMWEDDVKDDLFNGNPGNSYFQNCVCESGDIYYTVADLKANCGNFNGNPVMQCECPYSGASWPN